MEIKQNAKIATEAHIIKLWGIPEHARLRIQPRRRDLEYPVFCDLNDFIISHASPEKICILDFGAGASPYKGYFPNADYRRADILQTPELRYLIGPDSRIAEAEGTFDLIISTQVLEHVADPHAYLAESFRLLKKGGKLLLTTHGTWEEHGVPYDFQRWTEEGLKRDLELGGYRNPTIYKLTCGLRAALFIFIKNLFAARPPATQPGRLLFKAFRTTVSRIFPLLYRLCDKFWPEDSMVQVQPLNPGQTFYIVIATIAQK